MAKQAQSGLYRLLLVTMGLIAYGSLFPWRFDFGSPSPLLANWPQSINPFVVRDVIVNLAIYVPLGLFGFLILRERLGKAQAMLATISVGVALSTAIEVIQIFVPGRYSSAFDIVCNGLGTAAGVALAGLFTQTLRQVLAGITEASLLHPSRSLLLVYVWVGAQLYPFFPTLSVGVVRWKWGAVVADPALHGGAVLLAFGEWLAAARLLESILGPRFTRLALPMLVAIVPGKLLIAGRSLTLSELAGAGAAVVLWVLVLHRVRWRTAVALMALAAGITVKGLAPFVFAGPAGAFSWVPFGGVLGAGWTAALLILLQKTFWYGALLIGLRELGVGARGAIAGVAAGLAAIEIAQLYLHGHFAEITDPLMAVMLGMVLLGKGSLTSDPSHHGSSSVSQYK